MPFARSQRTFLAQPADHTPLIEELPVMRSHVTLLAFAVAIGAAMAGPFAAQAPVRSAQASGHFTITIGGIELTALDDGTIPYPTRQVLPTATAEQIERGLADAGLSDPVGMTYSGFLVRLGNRLVLIDVGTGGKLDEMPGFHGAGHLIANLRAAGHRPEQIHDVLISHVGPDHIGALVDGERRNFPNATVHIAARELAAYVDSSGAPSADSTWRRFRAALFVPYLRAGRLAPFDSDTIVAPGIRALATPGHTPGHTSYVIASRGQTLIVLGDLIHEGALQFAHPELPDAFDADRAMAIAQRERILRLAADSNYWIAGAHLPFPGIGHVRLEHGRYRFDPVNAPKK